MISRSRLTYVRTISTLNQVQRPLFLARYASQVVSVKTTSEEKAAGRLSERHLEIAVRHLLKDGLVVIENAVDHGVLDKLNEKMVEDAKILRDRKENSPFNYNRGNLQQDPPPVKEFFDPQIFLNPLATQITSTVLGPRPKWTFCSGNTAMPPQVDMEPQRQPVHADADFAHPDHAFALVVNVPLITMRPENGSTEVWLGSHGATNIADQEGLHGDRASGRIKEDLLTDRRRTRPPLQPVVPKGSLIVRDLRLWHAGMPNYSEETRVMLAMIHFAPWYRNKMRLEFGEGVRPMLEARKALDIRADFVSDDLAMKIYLDRGFGNSYDFEQTP